MKVQSQHPSKTEGVSIAIFATLFLHVVLLIAALFIHLQEPPRSDITVQLTFRRSEMAKPIVQSSEDIREELNAPTAKSSPHPAPPAEQPPQFPPEARAVQPLTTESIHADYPSRDSTQKAREMTLRSVLDRRLSPEQAWEILAKMLTEHPEFRDTVLKEMIAGQGYAPDSLPPVNLYLDQIFKNGIQPTWQAQRGAIESAFKSFDPVQGWTNKGGYGPQINIIGLIQFLIKLIEGK
ncbi:MAG: hypothetical protein WBQ23_06835 [Bacteroidota bacterium]